jgi:hypothetical protein
MSSLIADLESSPSSGDDDFVQSILNEINGGGGGGGGGAPPPSPSLQPSPPPPAVAYPPNQGVIYAPNPNTIAPHVMDNNPATAHIIGGSQPTPADFASMMSSTGGGGAGYIMPAGQGGVGPAANAAAYSPGHPVNYRLTGGQKRGSWLSRTLDEFRTPFFVVILVFLFSLPVVNFLFAHYLPRMVKPTGELTVMGLLIKSFAAGAAFWVLQRVVVPLLSL